MPRPGGDPGSNPVRCLVIEVIGEPDRGPFRRLARLVAPQSRCGQPFAEVAQALLAPRVAQDHRGCAVGRRPRHRARPVPMPASEVEPSGGLQTEPNGPEASAGHRRRFACCRLHLPGVVGRARSTRVTARPKCSARASIPRSIAKSRRVRRAPARRQAGTRSAGEASSLVSAEASACGSSGLTKSPLRPSAINSGMAVTLLATVATAWLCASMSTFGKPSRSPSLAIRLARTKTSAER